MEDGREPKAEGAEAFSQLMGGAGHVAVLTGAGVSRESEIPTFRDPDGLWSRFDPEEVATAEAFARDPLRVWSFHEELMEVCSCAPPNDAHRTIAAMEKVFRKVTVVTQNIDGLHQLAGSTDVIEVHGNAFRFRCMSCSRRWEHGRAPPSSLPPRCPCGGMARPDVVWFGEPLPAYALGRALETMSGCDALLVIGTSATVQPAASFPLVALESGARVLEFNMGRTPLSGAVHASFFGPAARVLPALWSAYRAL